MRVFVRRGNEADRDLVAAYMLAKACSVLLQGRPWSWRSVGPPGATRRGGSGWSRSSPCWLRGWPSKINIGHRYMLLIYPVAGPDRRRPDRRNPWSSRGHPRVDPAGLAGRQPGGGRPRIIWDTSTRSAGGPSQGYRYLVDSSLDWGQDLPRLRADPGGSPISAGGRSCYFGTANAQVYGLRTADWKPHPTRRSSTRSTGLAISATALQGVYIGSSDLITRFGNLPSIRVGYSIFLYDLSDPRVRAAWKRRPRARPATAPSRDPVRPQPPTTTSTPAGA